MKRKDDQHQMRRAEALSRPKSPLRVNREPHAPHDQPLTPARAVEIHIGELVLHGFTPAERRPVADALQAELAHLFADQSSVPDHSFEITFAKLRPLKVRQDQPAQSIGAGIAGAIFERLGHDR